MQDLILVAGSGAMGSGIAFLAAHGGYAVEIVEPDRDARQRALERIERSAQRAGDPSVVARIRWSNAMPLGSEAALAIEAVPERIELKREVFVAFASALKPDALIATNTSSLSVAELAEGIPNPQRVLGLHFFNPPEAMKLVEIVRAPLTGDDAIDRAYAFVERIGKTPVQTADTPGFIVNRVARPYYLQALRALERSVASVEELDALARAAGFRMGPFELMDFIGLDVNLATTESIFERTQASRLASVALQRSMVAQQLLGRKTGAGFYIYNDTPASCHAEPRSGVVEGRPRCHPELVEGRQYRQLNLAVEAPDGARNDDEFVAIVGFGGLADEIAELVEQRYTHVQRVENEDLLDELSADATIVFDVGNGAMDRGDVVAQLDTLLGPEAVFFVDAYATDLAACMARLRHPERLIGYGIVGSLSGQHAVEIVNSERVSDDALELAQEFFASLGKGVLLVEDVPGLFLGRVIGSIINEAVTLVAENGASADDVDTAMRLGTNYPIGPIAWGREIGGARATRILQRLAQAEGTEFTPHRSLWVLDIEQEEPVDSSVVTPLGIPNGA